MNSGTHVEEALKKEQQPPGALLLPVKKRSSKRGSFLDHMTSTRQMSFKVEELNIPKIKSQDNSAAHSPTNSPKHP